MGYKIKGLPYSVSRDHDRVVAIAAEIAKLYENVPKRPVSTVQAMSTQANVERQAESERLGLPTERDWNAPYADGWKVENDVVKANAHRDQAKWLEELAHGESLRKQSKNTQGQTLNSSVTDEAKARAVHHMTVSPPADMAKENPARITGLQPIESAAPPIEEWRPLPWYKAIWHWAKGGKVKEEKK